MNWETSNLNPFARSFILSSLGHMLDPLANTYSPNKIGFSEEIVPDHILNPLADGFLIGVLENVVDEFSFKAQEISLMNSISESSYPPTSLNPFAECF